MAVEQRRIIELGRLYAPGLSSVEEGPQLAIDKVAIKDAIQGAPGIAQPVSAAAYVSVEALVVKQTTYPAWFMALARDTQGHTYLDLVTRESKSSAWHLQATTEVAGGVPTWVRAPGGWAVNGTLGADISGQLAGYWQAATSGAAPTPSVASGSVTSELTPQFASAVSALADEGWTTVLSFTSGGLLPGAVRLTDGSTLGFAWVKETVKSTPVPTFASSYDSPTEICGVYPEEPVENFQEVDSTDFYVEGMSESVPRGLSGISLVQGPTGETRVPC